MIQRTPPPPPPSRVEQVIRALRRVDTLKLVVIVAASATLVYLAIALIAALLQLQYMLAIAAACYVVAKISKRRR